MLIFILGACVIGLVLGVGGVSNDDEEDDE